jgi:hypothetical protein
MFNVVLSTYRHYKLRQQVAKKLELLCRNNPPLISQWLNTESPINSEVKLKYAMR